MADAGFRVAVLGASGRWGRNLVRTLAEMDGAAVAWEAGSRTDWRGLLKTDRPDAVAVATPAPLHAEMALAALEAGLPVFVEKPMATSVADAERIEAAARSRGLAVVVDHVHLFNPAWRAVVEAASGLGRIAAASSEGGAPGPFRPDVTPLWDWGPHDVAMALDFAGTAPRTARCEITAEGNFAIRMEFAGGWTWSAVVGSRFPAKVRRARLEGARGAAEFDDLSAVKARAGGVALAHGTEPPLWAALAEFVAAARRRRAPVRSDAALGVAVVRVLEWCDLGLPPAERQAAR